MIAEKQLECTLAGEIKVLGENLPKRHFCPSLNPTWPDPSLNPGRRGGKPAIIFFILVCEAIGTAATPGLLCQLWVIVKMIAEKQLECTLAGEIKVLGENLPKRHFCPSQNPTWPDPGLNPGRRGGKPATNLLSYGAASVEPYLDTNFILMRKIVEGGSASQYKATIFLCTYVTLDPEISITFRSAGIRFPHRWMEKAENGLALFSKHGRR
jgi:hypothetical protein